MTDKLDRVVAYINSYTDPVAPTETVTVPRELLREVLVLATSDNNYIESELSPVGRSVRESQRARIAELRKAAGLDE